MDNKDLAVAVMQPYIFPYFGYFQMIYAVDVFVLYDDVNFIKQSWINRNKIIGSNNSLTFTLPLSKASSFKRINETEISLALFHNWKIKFLKTIEQTYSKAPYFNEVFKLIKTTLESESKIISSLAINSIKNVTQYLDIEVDFKISSKNFSSSVELGRTERLLSICQELKATHYINSIGGKELYDKKEFLKEGIELLFFSESIFPYHQFNDEFIPRLSIIDVLMFNSKIEILEMLKKYNLV